MDQNQQLNAMSMANCTMSGLTIQSQNLASAANATNTVYYYGDPPNTAWGYWQQYYYPQVIRESYPVYLQEKAMDKGKQAFEIVKSLSDKKLIKMDKVSDFIEAMDTILKTL